MGTLRAQRRATVQTDRTPTAARVGNAGRVSAFFVAGLDWAPRGAADYDASIRVDSRAVSVVPRPHPHVIGALSAFLPMVDIWRGIGKRLELVPGPYIGNADGEARTAAPGTDGYFPLWYRNLLKEF